mmetsp:Transcript_4569/g.8811  ORF Transcript_4569/g.8811 Transcript_4569/m.8811 type:complete len:164 (+) Transcript_4569:38-529(+)
MKFLAYRLSIIYFISIQCVCFVNGTTNVKWTGNQDPNAPEAARVPRSQKYWDENSIERPDYAKTDAEILLERILSDDSLSVKKIVLVLILFTALWIYLIRKYIPGARGQKWGGGVGSSSMSSYYPSNNKYSTALDPRGKNLDETARLARLSKFDSSTSTNKND